MGEHTSTNRTQPIDQRQRPRVGDLLDAVSVGQAEHEHADAIKTAQRIVHGRHGDIDLAVGWMARNGRISTGADRAEAIGATVDGWIADVEAGKDTAMLAWKRVNVEALNELGRQAFAERGWLTGPEITAPGGRRY